MFVTEKTLSTYKVVIQNYKSAEIRKYKSKLNLKHL